MTLHDTSTRCSSACEDFVDNNKTLVNHKSIIIIYTWQGSI